MNDATGTGRALQRLGEWFEPCPAAAVAFSGGVDSALVAFLARRFLGADRSCAYIADSPSLKRTDLADARRFCAEHSIRLVVLRTDELADPRYAANPGNRCYYCKSRLYETLIGHADLDPRAWRLNGTNVDDLGDHRPGLIAAGEHQVRGPLAECGVAKPTIRALARRFDLRCAEKPASPCMSSRIPYGQPVTATKLQQIEAGEAFLARCGFPVARLRHHGRRAELEVPVDRLTELRGRLDEIATQLRGLGFDETTIDSEGFCSGKLNRSLTTAARPAIPRD